MKYFRSRHLKINGIEVDGFGGVILTNFAAQNGGVIPRKTKFLIARVFRELAKKLLTISFIK